MENVIIKDILILKIQIVRNIYNELNNTYKIIKNISFNFEITKILF